MGNAEQVLVVILSSFLALFLVFGIIALYKVIQILGHLKVISQKAERLADTAETIGEVFRHTAGPSAIIALLSNISEAVLKHKKAREAKEDDGKKA